MSHLLMSVQVWDESETTGSIRIGVKDMHIAGCPSCLSVFALRISAALLNHIEEMRGDADGEGDENAVRHVTH